jgi:hypothetical protein
VARSTSFCRRWNMAVRHKLPCWTGISHFGSDVRYECNSSYVAMGRGKQLPLKLRDLTFVAEGTMSLCRRHGVGSAGVSSSVTETLICILCLTKHHAMKAYSGSGGIAPRILWPRH